MFCIIVIGVIYYYHPPWFRACRPCLSLVKSHSFFKTCLTQYPFRTRSLTSSIPNCLAYLGIPPLWLHRGFPSTVSSLWTVRQAQRPIPLTSPEHGTQYVLGEHLRENRRGGKRVGENKAEEKKEIIYLEGFLGRVPARNSYTEEQASLCPLKESSKPRGLVGMWGKRQEAHWELTWEGSFTTFYKPYILVKEFSFLLDVNGSHRGCLWKLTLCEQWFRN